MNEETLLYLDNVDEYVNDENKIVTYKWLSKSLKIHVNLAKRLLFMFIQQERNKKDNDDLSVTYFVAGLHSDSNGVKKHACSVVLETDLNAVRSSLSTVTSCHIYSVHKVKLKDTNALYATDFEQTKENIFDASSYSAIRCERSKPKSQEELVKQSQVSVSEDKPTVTVNTIKQKDSAPVSTTTTSNNKKKTNGKSNIASMFSQQSKTIKKETVEKPEVKKPEENKKTNKPEPKKDGMKSFFKKSDKTSPPPPSTVKKPEIEESKAPEKEVKESKKPEKESKKTPVEKNNTAKRKGKPSDSDDSNNKKSKRRRIKAGVFDSSSEEEMEAMSAEEEEEPLPRPVVDETEEPEEIIPPSPSPPKNKTKVPPTSGERKRKRTKKLVTKTFKDEDGFMLTEKVYETNSTDASESDKEDPIPASIKTSSTTETSAKQQVHKKKSPPKKASPAKGKQTSLTSFFTKK